MLVLEKGSDAARGGGEWTTSRWVPEAPAGVSATSASIAVAFICAFAAYATNIAIASRLRRCLGMAVAIGNEELYLRWEWGAMR